jgi:hypothetical protein
LGHGLDTASWKVNLIELKNYIFFLD